MYRPSGSCDEPCKCAASTGRAAGPRLARTCLARQRACLHGQACRTNRQAPRPCGHHHCNRLARAGKPATHARQRACLQRQAQQARRPAAARAGTPIATGLPARADRPAARASGLARAGRPAVRPLPARAGPVRPLLAQGPPLQLVCPRAFAQALSQQICLRGAQRPGLAQTCPDLPGFARICLDFGPKTAPQIALTCLGTPNNQLASVWIPSPCVYSLFSSGVA